MAREDITQRSVGALTNIEHWLAEPGRRYAVVAASVLAVFAIHAAASEPTYAWLAAVPVVIAGLAGGHREGLAVGAVAGAGHLAIDLVQGPGGQVIIIGALIRLVILADLGLLGAVLARVESQRDDARVRSATEDPVTGLLNVRAFYDGLRELQVHGKTFSVVLANVAGVRSLNETYGHKIGTEAIRALGHALRVSVKSGDLVGRLGSDEFALALVGADADGALAAAERLAEQLRLEELFLPDGSRLEVHAYFGIATYPGSADSEEELLKAADGAVSDARRQGLDTAVVASTE